jgi:NADPH:quinone reductase
MLAYFNTSSGTAAAELREVDAPSPAPNEVLVEVQAFSLNSGERSLLANRPEGWQSGQDVAGAVESAQDGSGPQVGNRVVALVEVAGWAGQVAVPTDRLAVLPNAVDFAPAATLPIAGFTALHTLRLGDSLLGRRVLIIGVNGGVGRIASLRDSPSTQALTQQACGR